MTHPTVCRSVIDAEYFTGFAQTYSFPIQIDNYIVPSISSLFCFSCPFAIFWTITSIIIDAFYCMIFGWTLTHIGKKIGKRFPSIADSYSATSIIVIMLRFWISASAEHRKPTSIFWGIYFSMFCHAIAVIASAASGISFNQTVRNNFNRCAAFANTSPYSIAVFAESKELANSQSSENLTGQIFDFRMTVNHDLTLLNRVKLWLGLAGVNAPASSCYFNLEIV